MSKKSKDKNDGAKQLLTSLGLMILAGIAGVVFIMLVLHDFWA